MKRLSPLYKFIIAASLTLALCNSCSSTNNRSDHLDAKTKISEQSLSDFAQSVVELFSRAIGCTTARYVVTFESNGGSSIEPQTTTYRAMVAEPTPPTRGGYTFIGWYNDSDLTTAHNFDTSINSELTLFAKWSISNPTIDLNRDKLRVLDIGNSYTNDAVTYLSDLVDASGIDVSDMYLYKAIRGGASFKTWCNIYNDADTTSYSILKVVGSLDSSVKTGWGKARRGDLFRETLSENEWDLIIIHQLSRFAPYYDRWNEDSGAGALDELIDIIKYHQPQATIGFLLVHSYPSNSPSNIEKSSEKRWRLIAESVERLRDNYGVQFIIPYGTAIQNLRASTLNTMNSATGYHNDFSSDGTHCASGLGDYVASCCYFETLFAPRYGVSVLGNSFNTIEVTEPGTRYQGAISVTPENAYTAQKAAILATQNMYECINPDGL